MMNLASAVKGPNSALFAAVVKTLLQVFPEVYVFALNPQKLTHVQGIIIVAATFDLKPDAILAGLRPDQQSLRKLLLTRVDPKEYHTGDGFLLTDRFNPVEYLVAQTIH
jgi:hypothetical protein